MNKKFLITAILFVSGMAAFAGASESIIVVSQQTLTDYARAIGKVSSIGTVPVTTTVWTYSCFQTRSGVACRYLPRTITLWSQPYTWTVLSPNFAVTPAGVSFTGTLLVQAGQNSVLQAFSLPATATFDPGTSSLNLNVSVTPVAFSVIIAGGKYSSSVVIGSFFDTHLFLTPTTFNVSGRALAGSL